MRRREPWSGECRFRTAVTTRRQLLAAGKAIICTARLLVYTETTDLQQLQMAVLAYGMKLMEYQKSASI
jgi:hypothetical protein